VKVMCSSLPGRLANSHIATVSAHLLRSLGSLRCSPKDNGKMASDIAELITSKFIRESSVNTARIILYKQMEGLNVLRDGLDQRLSAATAKHSLFLGGQACFDETQQHIQLRSGHVKLG